jgi:hypothetical protein
MSCTIDTLVVPMFVRGLCFFVCFCRFLSVIMMMKCFYYYYLLLSATVVKLGVTEE